MKSPILGFHHIALIVSDYEKSKHFYTRILGAEIIAETYREQRASYKLDLRFKDGSQIELFSFLKRRLVSPRPKPAGFAIWHFEWKILNMPSHF